MSVARVADQRAVAIEEDEAVFGHRRAQDACRRRAVANPVEARQGSAMPAIRSVTVYAASSRRAPPTRSISQPGSAVASPAAAGRSVRRSADRPHGRARGCRARRRWPRPRGSSSTHLRARSRTRGLHALETVGDMRSRKAGLSRTGATPYVVAPGRLRHRSRSFSEILAEQPATDFHLKPLLAANHRGFWDPSASRWIDRQVRDGLVHELSRAPDRRPRRQGDARRARASTPARRPPIRRRPRKARRRPPRPSASTVEPARALRAQPASSRSTS